jgi:orotidine-5'-phosphate decarboxylase
VSTEPRHGDGPRVIVALDFPDAAAALAFAARVAPGDCRLKVGLELFAAGGPDIVRRLVERGFDVFLDLKFHDIPNTVARACARAADLGVWMLNVHALGGRRMLEAARAAIDPAARRPLLTAVTILTSHARDELAEIGLTQAVDEQVVRLARLAADCGLDGVVCSAAEAVALRRECGPDFVLVTPGIRPAGSAGDDQRRIATPRAARAQGADFLVIGRPITAAAEPDKVLAGIRAELGDRA